MTDREFCETFEFTSRTGRVYTRSMIIAATTRHRDARLLKLSRSEIAQVVGDDVWLRSLRMKGCVPRRVSERVISEVHRRKIAKR